MSFQSMFRPQRQLQVRVASVCSHPQRRSITTQRHQLPNYRRNASRQARRHPALGLCKQLSTLEEGHILPKLSHFQHYRQQGIDGLFSPEGFDLAWTQYQSFIIERLNDITRKSADATTKVSNLVEKYARSPDNASLFNHASMAYNNHFFFQQLSPTKTEPSPTFVEEVKDSFSSFESLRAEMIETADAMFGPGFVWIVSDNETGRMSLLCTYLAGTPLPGTAHSRVQPMDMMTSNPHSTSPFAGDATNSTGSFGAHYRNPIQSLRIPRDGYNARPMLCVNTWPQVYLRDYGVAGKRAYLERWWDRIDWHQVEGSARAYAGSLASRRRRPSTIGRTVNQSLRDQALGKESYSGRY